MGDPHPGSKRADAGGEIAQDAEDLSLLFVEQLAPLVAELDSVERLEEDGGPGRGCAVDDAGELSSQLGLNGDHVAAVAQRDDRFLDRGAMGAEDLVEPGREPIVGDARVAAQLGEHLGGAIDDLATVVNCAGDRSCEVAEVVDAVGDLGEERDVYAQALNRIVRAAGDG